MLSNRSPVIQSTILHVFDHVFEQHEQVLAESLVCTGCCYCLGCWCFVLKIPFLDSPCSVLCVGRCRLSSPTVREVEQANVCMYWEYRYMYMYVVHTCMFCVAASGWVDGGGFWHSSWSVDGFPNPRLGVVWFCKQWVCSNTSTICWCIFTCFFFPICVGKHHHTAANTMKVASRRWR